MAVEPRAVDAWTLANQLADLADQHEAWRGRETLNLNAANNVLSPPARRMLSTRLADKGISGGLGRRHHMGGRVIDEMEQLVLQLAQQVFATPHVEYRPASGSFANALAIAALTSADDTLMVLGEAAPGHQSYRRDGWGGRLAHRVVDLPFDPDRFDVDVEAFQKAVERTRPRLIVLGTALFIFPYDLAPIRQVADRVGALLMYDAAHPLGLIGGGVWDNPLDGGADLVTGSTQKSLFGPIGGLILTRSADLGERLFDQCTRLVSNYENNRIMALGVALAELAAFGHDYASACVANAQALAASLAQHGLSVVGAERGFTRSNQVLLHTRGGTLSADDIVERWEAANIIATAMALPAHADAPPVSVDGIRIGVQELTRLGMGSAEMNVIGGLLARAAGDPDSRAVKSTVGELVHSFTTIYYTFEHPAPPRRQT